MYGKSPNVFFGETIQPAPEGYLSLREAAAELGKQYTDVYMASGTLRLELERFIGSNNRLAFHLTPEQLDYLRAYFDSGARPPTDGSVKGVQIYTGPQGDYMEEPEDQRQFRALPHALVEGFKRGDLNWSRKEYTAEVGRWKAVCTQLADAHGAAFYSGSPETVGINTIIALYDMVNGKYNPSEPEFYGVYLDNRVRRLHRPGNTDSPTLMGESVLFDKDSSAIPKPIAKDVVVSDATADEIVKLEALINLSLPDGKLPTSVAPEAVPYQSEMAREMGRLCLRAVEELGPWDDRAETLKRVLVPVDDQGMNIWIGQKIVPAADFPDATIMERFVSFIDTTRQRGPVRGDNYGLKGHTEHVLLYDGSIVKIRIVREDTGEEEDFSGFSSFAMMPAGPYTPIFEAPDERALIAALGLIREKLGPEIDWDNVGLGTVLQAASKVFDMPPEGFRKKDNRSRRRKMDVVNRGLAFMLALDKKVASVEEIADTTGMSRSLIRRNVLQTRHLLEQDDQYGHGQRRELRKLHAALIRALPRVSE